MMWKKRVIGPRSAVQLEFRLSLPRAPSSSTFRRGNEEKERQLGYGMHGHRRKLCSMCVYGNLRQCIEVKLVQPTGQDKGIHRYNIQDN
jgi:hypothetical protein